MNTFLAKMWSTMFHHWTDGKVAFPVIENVNIGHLYQALHQLLTTRTPSASVERIFSTCGLVQY